MARILTCGWDLQSTTIEGGSSVIGASISTPGSYGSGSALLFGAAGGKAEFLPGLLGGILFIQFDLIFGSVGSSNRNLCSFGIATNSGNLTLDTTGCLGLGVRYSSPVGSSYALSPSVWYKIGIKHTFDNAAGSVILELFVNGVSQGSSSGNVGTDPYSPCGDFWLNVGSGTGFVAFDNLRINDDAWPPSRMATIIAASDGSIGSGWQKPGGVTTGLSTSVDNLPPVGIANSASSANAEKMIRNASSNSASVTFNLQSLSAAGISGTIKRLTPVAVVGSSTSSKTGSIGTTSNPAISATSFGTYYSGAAQGAFPVGWKTIQGAAAVNPTINTAAATVLSLNLTGGTASAVASCCFVGAYVEWEPPLIPVYMGSKGRSVLYRGSKTDTQIHLGVRPLF